MKTQTDSKMGYLRTTWLASLIVIAVASLIPSTATAQTFRSSSAISTARFRSFPSRLATMRLSPRVTGTRTALSPTSTVVVIPRSSTISVPASDPRPALSSDVSLSVDVSGSYSALISGDVVVRRNGVVLARGSLNDELFVAGGSPVDVAVTVTSLVDRPTIVMPGVSLPSRGGALSLPVQVATGLVRAQATVAGRRVSGVVRFYRIDEATGVVSSTSCGSIGANTSSQEISAGRYRAVLLSGGATLTRDVTIVAGGTRLVRLEG